MVLDVLRKQEGLTASERLVADYMLAHPDDVSSLTAAELARRALTSKSCVMRLCRKAGCERFTSFKSAFAAEWRDYAHVHQMLSREPFGPTSTTDQVVKGVASIYERVLVQAALEVDQQMVDCVVEQLASSDAIRLHGTGMALSIAQVAAFKLEALGIPAVATDGINEHYLANVMRGKVNLCAILLSFTGGNAAMVAAARTLRARGIYTVGIGETHFHDLADVCDVYFDLGEQVPVINMEAVETTVLMNYMLDVLITSLTVRDYNRHLSRSLEVFAREHR